MGYLLEILFLIPITGILIFFFIIFKFLNPSILNALAPPIIDAFAEAKTKEGESNGPLGIGWQDATKDFLILFKINLLLLFMINFNVYFTAPAVILLINCLENIK